jgi:hypothetical protein
MYKYHAPVVPLELQPYLTDDVLAIHEELANGKLSDFIDIEAVMEPTPKLGKNNRSTRPFILGDSPEAGVEVIAHSHQQAKKESKVITALVSHRISNPNGMTIVLPNNSISDRFYRFSENELEQIDSGNMNPFYEMQVRTVERVLQPFGPAVGHVALKGWLLGGLTVMGMSAVGSDRLDIRYIGSGEAPNKEQTEKELNKGFINSGGWGEQRAAIADAHLPMLSHALRRDKLALDWARFGVANFANKGNRALKSGMATPGFEALTERALAQNTDAVIRAAHVAGSLLFDPKVVSGITDERFTVDYYAEGEGSHAHATADNPFAFALAMN